jgi:hypothetical protein
VQHAETLAGREYVVKEMKYRVLRRVLDKPFRPIAEA